MDFFEHQEVARKKTALLVVYFVLAVILIVAAVYLVVATGLTYSGWTGDRAADELAAGNIPEALWDWQLFAMVSVGTIALISGGSLFRIASLAGGGHKVAELLGGRPLSPNTSDPDERKVLNVVEEMALASGTPVPPVYLLEGEEGINAFAAGFNPGDAVIGVTRGVHSAPVSR